MSGLAWIILNLALAIGAVYGTLKVRNTPAPKPLQLEEAPQPQTDAQHKATAPRNDKAAAAATAKPRALPANAPMDDLWRQTLFLPTRTEDTADAEAAQEAEQAALAARNIEFELVGLAQINVIGEADPVPVAILRSKVGSERGGRGPQRRSTPRDRNTPLHGPQQPAAAKAETAAKNDEKQVFRVGEKINQTGYLLRAIDLDAKMVEVTRNGEDVKLYINFAGSEAAQRRDAVTQAANQKHQEQQRRIEQENRERQQAQQAQAAAQQPNNGAPPAPDGAPAEASNANVPDTTTAPTSNPTSPDARAERLRRIAEARQQRQARQNQSSNQQNATQQRNSSNAMPPPPPGN